MSLATQSPVDAYMAGLSRALSGPRRRKADLMAEARDGLEDATEAYQADGLDRVEAELRAVEDFGELADVVPGYRAELSLAEGRRTAVLLALVVLAQPIVWLEGAWSWTQEEESANAFVAVLNQLVMVVGTISGVGALLALVGTGLGLRYPWIRDRAARATAVFALVCSVLIGVIAIGMSVLSNELNGSAVAALAIVGAFVLVPFGVVSYSARRCLRLA